jgi:uncharacterized protein YjiS (DUF1127 family)
MTARTMASAAADAAKRMLARIAEGLFTTTVAVRAPSIERKTVACLGRLDDRTLKDIGLHRSELGSVAWDNIERRRGRY